MLFVGEWALSCYLVFNLMMLLMDLKVSSLLLDQLFILVDSKALSLEKFNLVRNDIHRRVAVSKWASDFIVVPCVASAVAIALMLIINQLSMYNFALILVKELIFVGIAFWYVAKVNEKADLLTVALSTSMWEGAGGVSDVERLSICTSCMIQPISFPLLFKRLSVPNVLVSFGGFALSIVVGIIKQSMGV